MSKAFTTKTVMPLEPGISGLDLATTGIKHNTAADFAAKLEDLAMLAYRRGRAKYKLALNQTTTAGEVTVSFRAGAVEVGSDTFTVGGNGQVFTGAVDLNLGGVAGETGITMRVNVDTAADASTTAQAWGQVEVSTPLVVSSC